MRARPPLSALAAVLCWALWLPSAACWAAEFAALEAAVHSITADELTHHVEVLADDTFEGREAGSRGGRAAAGYLAKQMQRCGLEPAGTDGAWFQPIGAGQWNLLGIKRGQDLPAEGQVILVGAHYDHVGYGTPSNSYGPTGYIHNGADDNASGVSALLETAQALEVPGITLRRTVLFALWDAEEKGLVGSRHWLAQPTVPLGQVALAINLDMVGRLRNNRLELLGTRSSYGLRRLVSWQNRDSLQLDFIWKLRSDSDHWPFFERGIPILMFHTGLHEDYHRPSDDVEKINSQGLEQVTRLLLLTLVEAGNADKLAGFRTAARSETPAMQQTLEQPLSPPRPRLGIAWDDNDHTQPGLRITAVTPGSPAAKAGLRVGDRLVELAGRAITSGDQLKAEVSIARSPVTVRRLGSGKTEPEELSVELAGEAVHLGLAWREDDAEPASVLVTRVVPGSPADQAGLRVKDRVCGLNGQPLGGSEEFRQRVLQLAGPIELLVERQGQIARAELVLPPLEEEQPRPAVDGEDQQPSSESTK